VRYAGEGMRDALARLIIGDSPEIERLRQLILKVAPSRLPVLVEGPTGAGKELVADALHRLSGRSGAYVAFNVCAIPDTMFEDALFGHAKGAFTGATADSAGYLAEANGGTVFLDEIGGLPIGMQSKLLRAIETQQFRPVGGRLDRRSEFRVVAASNESLTSMVREHRFRSDLLHRIGGVVLRVPPLSERAGDVTMLATYFAERSAHQLARHVSFTPSALEALRIYEWPGNVRELRSVVEALLVFSDGPQICARDIEVALSERRIHGGGAADFAHRARLLDLLEHFDGDTALVASALGVGRATVYRRMQRLGVAPPKRASARTDSRSASDIPAISASLSSHVRENSLRIGATSSLTYGEVTQGKPSLGN